MTRKSVAALLLLGVAATFLATGCGRETCLPEPVTAAPGSVRAGTDVTLTGPAAACDIGYPENKTYTLRLHSDSGKSTEPLEFTAEVARDGSFSSRIPAPRDFAAGNATILVDGSPMDDCDDTNACAAFMAHFAVTR